MKSIAQNAITILNGKQKKKKITSKTIIIQVTKALAESVTPVKEKLGFGDQFTIVLAGSVFTHQGSEIGSRVKELLEKK